MVGSKIPIFSLKIFYYWSLMRMILCYRRVRWHVKELDPRIVGGKNAKIEDYPFMVMVIVDYKEKDKSLCGGSYVRDVWVLTAAHCLDVNNHNTNLKPAVGEHDRVLLKMEVDDLKQTKFQHSTSEELHIHPEYFRNNTEVLNDIGIIEIKAEFAITKKAKLAKLPHSVIDYSGAPVTIIGWGATGFNDTPSNLTYPTKLQKLQTHVHDLSVCNYNGIICIGKAGEIACSGDSGGPLIYLDMVIGICSYGFGCSGELAVYEDIFRHMPWILETFGELNDGNITLFGSINTLTHIVMAIGTILAVLDLLV